MLKKLSELVSSLEDENEKKLFTQEIIDSIIYNLKEEDWEFAIEAVIEEKFKNKVSAKRLKILTGSILKAALEKKSEEH